MPTCWTEGIAPRGFFSIPSLLNSTRCSEQFPAMKVGPQARSEAETVGVCESPHTTAHEAHLGICRLYNNNNNTRELQLQGKPDLTASRLYHAITAAQAWHAPEHAVSCRPTSKKATWHLGPTVGFVCKGRWAGRL